MSQSLHFQQIACFREEFTKECNHEDILQYLKLILSKEEKLDESIQERFFDNSIHEEIELLHVPVSDSISKFLEDKNSKQLLYEESRYFFVDEELWKAVKTEIFKKIMKKQNNVQDKDENLEKLIKDFKKIIDCYEKKMLVFEAS